MGTFKAIRIDKAEKGTTVALTQFDEAELMEGDVLPEVMGGLHVISTPGHAPDHISFWQPDRKVLIIGDVIMKFFGRMRLPLAVSRWTWTRTNARSKN